MFGFAGNPQLHTTAAAQPQYPQEQQEQPSTAPEPNQWAFVFMPQVPQQEPATHAAPAMEAQLNANSFQLLIAPTVARPAPQPGTFTLVLPPGPAGPRPGPALQPIPTPTLVSLLASVPGLVLTRAELANRAITQIRDVLPDIEPGYLVAHVSACVDTLRERTAEHVLGVLFEAGAAEGEGYPKVSIQEPVAQPWPLAGGSNLGVCGGKVTGPHESAKNGEKLDAAVDYEDTNRPAPSQAYRRLSLYYLRLAFPFLPKHVVTSALCQHNDQYAPTYLHLHVKEQQYAAFPIRKERPYRCNSTKYSGTIERRALAQIWDSSFGEEWLWVEVRQGRRADIDYIHMHLRHGAPYDVAAQHRASIGPTPEPRGAILNGQTAVQSQLAEAVTPDVDVEMVSVEEQLAEEADSIECGCCFSNYTSDQIVHCPSEHRFCSDCVLQYAAIQLGAHNPSLVCMHSSDCKLPFPESELSRVLTPTLMVLYTRLSTQRAIIAAGLQDLEECPFCDWQCVIEAPVEMDCLFRCGNDEGGCGAVSCRKCKKMDHFPQMCKGMCDRPTGSGISANAVADYNLCAFNTEMEEDGVLNGQHAVEEAMTAALMRNCPNLFCKKPFVKDAGCNKMVCTHCRTVSCYICRQIITGYEHFDQMPGAPANAVIAGRCKLWDDTEERHANEIQQAAERAIHELKLAHAGVNGGEIAIAHHSFQA